jgi:hypothetical protein
MGFFRASAQYGDWKGTAAADNARRDLDDYLTSHGLIKEKEFLIAVSLFVSQGFVSIRALAVQGSNLEAVQAELTATEDPIRVREIRVELTTEKFLNLFKIFNVVLIHRGLDLEERQYSETR